MMTTTAAGYEVVPDDDAESYRIIAVAADGTHICGAYRSRRLNDWKIYVCKPFVDGTGLAQPQKAHVINRDDAVRWVDMLAHYYTRSTKVAAA